jgi:4-hydroxy-L-threonine phosphate dehydrogenase PdxA
MTRLLSSLYKIALTCGDADGVGFEVATKALTTLSSRVSNDKTVFFLFRSTKADQNQKQFLKLLDRHFLRLTFSSLEQALLFFESLHHRHQLPKNVLIDLSLSTSPAEWVLQASLACQNGLLDSLVTGPLSKKLTVQLKGRPIGHTGIFRQLYPKSPMHMAFIGTDFNVMLATDHISLNEVEKELSLKNFKSALLAGEKLQRLLKNRKKIAVLGLNPHAGEKGIIGFFESKMKRYLKSNKFEGFISPDAAFLKKNLNKFSLFLALYHDQGLIPFKMHHGQDSGVHVTIGLPFIRTSVDHGTANDIFNKNIANPQSMIDAIQLNLKLLGVRNV